MWTTNNQTKNIAYPQNNISIILEVGEETTLLPDIDFWNCLCTQAKIWNLHLFLLASDAPRNCPRGDPTEPKVYPGTLKKFRSIPSQENEPIFLEQTRILRQVSTLNNILHYIASDLCTAANPGNQNCGMQFLFVLLRLRVII